MPLARTKRGRVRQVANWLRAEFPTPWPVRISLLDLGNQERCYHGACSRRGRKLAIEVNHRAPKYVMIGTLLHEWAHAMTWPVANLEESKPIDHDAEWGLAYARIVRAYEDFDGWKTSRQYPETA